ncbi:hypothetical protein PsorP6_019255 [Peronosclerospora sorghi]|nr:hypothetical protein PsorP6_019255 [Peronosclerospora sorghi]
MLVVCGFSTARAIVHRGDTFVVRRFRVARAASKRAQCGHVAAVFRADLPCKRAGIVDRAISVDPSAWPVGCPCLDGCRCGLTGKRGQEEDGGAHRANESVRGKRWDYCGKSCRTLHLPSLVQVETMQRGRCVRLVSSA